MVACNKHSINIQKDPSASTESWCTVTSGLQLYPDAPALGSPSSPKQRRETYVLETGIELQGGANTRKVQEFTGLQGRRNPLFGSQPL